MAYLMVAEAASQDVYCGFPKIAGTMMGVPIIRIIVFGGLPI